MANLKEIRLRITSVQGTRQITSAMKMVSAAKLRKAQDTIIQMRPYANKLQHILADLTENLEAGQENIYGTVHEIKKVLIIAISSNKGLCGGFNANVSKQVIQMHNENYKDLTNEQVDVLAIGKKAADLLTSKGIHIAESKHDLLDDLSFDRVVSLAKGIMEAFATGAYDEVKIVYNQFRNAGTQELIEEQYLPVLPPEKDRFNQSHSDYILEPSKDYIIEKLIPKSLKVQLYKAFLDSIASEHGARMTAMHKATDNASDMIKELQLEYNKARQAAITTEILEIVSGAEALKG